MSVEYFSNKYLQLGTHFDRIIQFSFQQNKKKNKENKQVTHITKHIYLKHIMDFGSGLSSFKAFNRSLPAFYNLAMQKKLPHDFGPCYIHTRGIKIGTHGLSPERGQVVYIGANPAMLSWL